MPGGHVTLDPSRGQQLTMILVDLDRQGGAGGWELADRYGRGPATWWRATPADALSLSCLIDTQATRASASAERRIDVLRAMGRPGEADEPPTVRLRGDVLPPDRAATWVIQDIKFSKGARLPTGELFQVPVSMDLVRHRAFDDVEPVGIRATRGRSGRRRTRLVRARGGDTLRAIALRELGGSGRWRDLRKWNKHLRRVDPDARLRAGTKIAVKG